MNITSQLRIAAWLPALFGLLIGSLLWLAWGQVDAVRVRADMAERIVESLFQQNVLIQEFLLYGGPRVSNQLSRHHDTLSVLLGQAQFVGAPEQALLESIRRGHLELDRLLGILRGGTAVSREQIAGALLAKVQDVRLKARELSGREHAQVVLIQRVVDRWILAALAVLTLFSVGLLTWLSRRLMRGLDQLGTGMQRVEGGELGLVIDLGREDELGRLAVTFNAMSHRLRESYISIDRLEGQVRERTRVLQQRTSELEAANADLEAFGYSVSHDLRAPLRAIDGFSAILREDYAPQLDAEGVRLLGVVANNARRMGQLLDDILAFSRAGRQTLRLADLDMDAMVKEIWEGLEPQRCGRTLELHAAGLLDARGDPGAIRLVWQNLLANAVKFTRPRASALIEVGCRRVGDANLYWVSDNGVGFDPAYTGKLFGLFQRLHGMDEFEGTGVGLAIVKRFVQKHGGRVDAEGRPGEGATFRFTLPAMPPAIDRSETEHA